MYFYKSIEKLNDHLFNNKGTKVEFESQLKILCDVDKNSFQNNRDSAKFNDWRKEK